MKKGICLIAAVLLMAGASFAQDDMKKDAKQAKKEVKAAGNDVKADAAKGTKHMHKSVKKTEKKVTTGR
jgi:ABC-type enterochelin transport system substrate-binding protein